MVVIWVVTLVIIRMLMIVMIKFNHRNFIPSFKTPCWIPLGQGPVENLLGPIIPPVVTKFPSFMSPPRVPLPSPQPSLSRTSGIQLITLECVSLQVEDSPSEQSPGKSSKKQDNPTQMALDLTVIQFIKGKWPCARIEEGRPEAPSRLYKIQPLLAFLDYNKLLKASYTPVNFCPCSPLCLKHF